MQYYEVLLRLLLAVLVGGLIGYEREYNNRPAGLRTHILVCIGATVVSLIQIYTISDISSLVLKHPELANALKGDIGRMGAQVISGIGFLGAGTIIHQRGSIKGLTTAATLWVVACIGLAVGMGYYFLSISAAVSVFLLLILLKKMELKLLQKINVVKLKIRYTNKTSMMKQIEDYFNSQKIKVKQIEFIMDDENNEQSSSIYTVLVPRYMSLDDIMQDISCMDDVIRVSLI